MSRARKPSYLPGVLAEIAEAAGVDAAMKVANIVGGRRAYFAAEPAAESWLARTVGIDAAKLIGSCLAPAKGGVELEVPLGPAGARARTWYLIREMIDAGATKSEIVRVTGVHPRTVQRHRNGHSGHCAGPRGQR